MSTTLQRSSVTAPTVRPSIASPSSVPFTLDQELKPFGTWVDSPLWVPPKDSSTELAETMLRNSGCFTSKSKSWDAVVDAHRDDFTEVREIELSKASIRLPKGRLLVSLTQRKHFDQIEEIIPACVQTRLDEFLAGPGKKPGVKVYYLKPLCIEVGDDLVFTSRQTVVDAIEKIQAEVFAQYRRSYLPQRAKRLAVHAAKASLAVPTLMVKHAMDRRQKSIDGFQARLEFRRRQTALDAAKAFHQNRTTGCTFDDMLDLTMPLERGAVIKQYSVEQELSRAKQKALLRIAAGQLPWFAGFATIAGTIGYLSTITITFAPPILMCDPAFVAEFPGSGGVVLNIGHFDDVAGVRHVEM